MKNTRPQGVNFVQPDRRGPGWEAYLGLATVAAIAALVFAIYF